MKDFVQIVIIKNIILLIKLVYLYFLREKLFILEQCQDECLDCGGRICQHNFCPLWKSRLFSRRNGKR